MSEGILVLAAQRDLRRRLFDVFDRAGCRHIHSARDAQHAAILLEGRQPLELMVAVLGHDAAQARRCCEQLRALAAGASAPLLAILDEDAPLQAAQLPDDVAGWLHAAQIEAELLTRWRELPPAASATAATVTPSSTS